MQPEVLEKLKQRFGALVEFDVPFSQLTTVSIGGPAKALIRVKDTPALIDALSFAKQEKVPFLVMGGGSNLLVSDQGLDSLVIKIETDRIEEKDETVIVDSGTSLQRLIDYTIDSGYAGIHKMTGIPGSVGGAVYGNAGAYGQTISDYLTEVVCLKEDHLVTLFKHECNFEYRDSGFKTNGLVILEVHLQFPTVDKETLQKESADCLSLRQKKYPPNTKCPGSFFKNLFTHQIPKPALDMLPPREDTFGKTPAYIFIEELGLKGKQVGQIKIADYHGNLFINLGGGTAEDFWKLAKECFDKTKNKYGVELEPEVQLINLPALDKV